MKIGLSITGALKKPQGKSEDEIHIDKGKSIRDILIEYGYKEKDLEFIMCFLNDKPVDINSEVKDKDTLCLTMTVSGG